MRSLIKASVVALAITLLGASTAHAYYDHHDMFFAQVNDPSEVTVKVNSYFERDSENKLEGSGFLFRNEGQLLVLTSEHVVIPSNAPAVHEIVTGRGYKMEAEFLRSSWSRGLALLRIKNPHPNVAALRVPQALGYLSSSSRVDTPIDVKSYGFPAGVKTLIRGQGSTGPGRTLEEGVVLARQRVQAVTGLRTEFGMSGGPVLSGIFLFGLITHVTHEQNSQTFVIPIADAMEWARNAGYEPFTRTYQDLQVQYFSRSRTEIVRQLGANLQVEKRGSTFLISRLPGFSGSGTVLSFTSALTEIWERMWKEQLRVVMVLGVTNQTGSHRIDGKTTLPQLLGFLMSEKSSAEIRDFESTEPDPSSGLTPVPSFFPRKDYTYNQQRAEYELMTVTWPLVRKESFAGVYWERVRTPVHGWLVATIWDVNSNQIQNLHRYHGDFSDKQHIYKADVLASMDWWRDKLANCQAEGGEVEIINVKAGRYQTCRKIRGDLKVWYGPAPVSGIIKMQALDGSYLRELTKVVY